jgi:hypothetical protein
MHLFDGCLKTKREAARLKQKGLLITTRRAQGENDKVSADNQPHETQSNKNQKAQDACNILSLHNRDALNIPESTVTSMLNQFLSNVYSEELTAGISEADYAEVMNASATDYEGYAEWSEAIEQGEVIDTPKGQILYNKDCSHAACKTTRCEKGATYQGIAI